MQASSNICRPPVANMPGAGHRGLCAAAQCASGHICLKSSAATTQQRSHHTIDRLVLLACCSSCCRGAPEGAHAALWHKGLQAQVQQAGPYTQYLPGARPRSGQHPRAAPSRWAATCQPPGESCCPSSRCHRPHPGQSAVNHSTLVGTATSPAMFHRNMTGRLCTNQQHPKHLQDVPCRVIGGHYPGREAQLAGKHRPVQRCSQHMRSLQVQARAAYASRAAHTQATARLHRRMINQDATQLHAVVQQSHSSSSNSWAPAHIRKPSHPKYNSTARDYLSPTGPCERCSHNVFHAVLMAAKPTQRPFPVAKATCCVNSRHSGLHTCGKESRQWQVSHAGTQLWCRSSLRTCAVCSLQTRLHSRLAPDQSEKIEHYLMQVHMRLMCAHPPILTVSWLLLLQAAMFQDQHAAHSYLGARSSVLYPPRHIKLVIPSPPPLPPSPSCMWW